MSKKVLIVGGVAGGSELCSKDALSAVTLAFPIQMIIISLFVGLAVGINSVIARRLGEQNRDEAVNSAEHGFFFGIIIWIFLALLAIKLPGVFFVQFTENQQIIDYGITYITIILVFSIARIITQVFISILQATGAMMSAMVIQGAGAITNILLDGFLIFGWWIFPEMGVAGAAIATVIGQFVSLILAIIIYSTRQNRLKLNLRKFHLKKDISKNILSVGIPAMVMQGLGSIMLYSLNRILSKFGDDAYTFLGVYFRIQSFIFMPVFGLNQGMMPVLGYNFGAGNKKRVTQALKVGLITAVSIMAIGTIVFQLFPADIINIYEVTDSIVEIGIPAFRIISSLFVLAAVNIVLSVFFQAIGDAYIGMIISFARQILILVPAAWILSRSFGLTMTWLAFPIAEALTTIIVILFTIYEYNKKIKNLVPLSETRP